MAQALLKLEGLNIGNYLSQVRSLSGQASTYAKMGAPTMPGIPDIKEKIKSKIEVKANSLPIKARKQILILLAGVMSGVLINNIPKINKIIRSLNRVIKGIKRAIDSLIPIAKTIFKIIIALTIAYTIAKVVGLIPSPGVGMGAVVVFDMAKTICAELINIISALLESLWPLAYSIIGIIMLLLSIFSFIQTIIGIIQAFSQQQTNASAGANNAFSKSADDWANSTDIGYGGTTGDGDGVGSGTTGGVGDIAGMGSLSMVECTLPSGEIRQMTAEDCIASGGTFPDMDLLSQLNACNFRLRKCISENKDKSQCIKIKQHCDELANQLGNLSGFQLDDNVILSLLNLNDNVTVEKAIKHKGKRYGFYGSESGTAKTKEELSSDKVSASEEADLNALVDELNNISEEINDDSSDKMKTIEETLIDVKTAGPEDRVKRKRMLSGQEVECHSDVEIDCSKKLDSDGRALCDGKLTIEEFIKLYGTCPKIINNRRN